MKKIITPVARNSKLEVASDYYNIAFNMISVEYVIDNN